MKRTSATRAGAHWLTPENPVRPKVGWWRPHYVILPMAAVLVLTLSEMPIPAPAAAPTPVFGDIEKMIEQAQQEGDVPLPRPSDVAGVRVRPIPPVPQPPLRAAGTALTGGPQVVWPAGGEVAVRLPTYHAALAEATGGAVPESWLGGRQRAGHLPVRVGAAPGAAARADSAPAAVRVRVADRAQTRAAGVSGLVLGVSRDDGVARAGEVAVEIDVSRFRHAYGGDWASRLRVDLLEPCPGSAAAAPLDRTVCGSVALPTSRDLTAGSLAATVPLAATGATTLLAVSAGDGGDNGTYTATSLSPAGTWQVTEQTGAFGWSHPLRTVPAPAGPEPELSLTYSAQSVDGRTANTNGQGSWIGDGWELWPGYVERSYQQCSEDKDPVGGQQPNNRTVVSYDQCWFSDNASMSLNGEVTELVKAANGTWRGVADDGTRIEQVFAPSLGNGTHNGEYWKATTTDGTQYFFGRHRREGFPTDTAATNSTWVTPVYGNHPGEPCHASGNFAGSRCAQGWRWNLDYVKDPHGNTMTLFYAHETGAYGREGDPAKRTTYHRGGYLTRIEYGTRAGTEHSQTAPARVEFDVADRCLPGQTCSQSNPQAWPDVPWDRYCAAAPCTDKLAPTFWTQKRLAKIRSQVLRSGTFHDVESWTLRHSYLDAGAADGEGVPMWLSGITRAGHVTTAGGAAASEPEIVFEPGSLPLANRVDGPSDGKTRLNRWRLHRIRTETGAIINVSYSAPECTAAAKPTPHTNTKRCFPQWYGPNDDDPTLDWFHKYVTTQVTIEDVTGASPRMETHYEYLDTPAWHYDDSELVKPKKRTWSQWRGYSKVRVRQGLAAEPQSAVEYLYLRGMHGDRAAPSGGTKSVQVTDSQGVSITDHEAHAGFLREETVLNGPGGQWVEGTINTPWRHGPTASAGPLRAYLTDTGEVRSRTRLEGGGTRWTRVTTTFDTTYGLPVTIDDRGDEATAADDVCTRHTYARNTTAWLVDLVSRTETVGVRCDQTPSRPADVLSDERTFYDNPDTFGATPTRGLAVREQEVGSWNGTTPVWVTTSRTGYDVRGRAVEEYDALNRRTTTGYTPATGGPVTQTTTTNPKGHTATDVLEPAWGLPTRVTDENGHVSQLTYDGLGRLTRAWLPGRNRDTDLPDLRFTYLVRKDAPTAITTETLLPTGDSYRTSISLYDGMLRERQKQVSAHGGGRVVSDLVYNSRGLLEWASRPYYDVSNAPPSTTLVGAGMPAIPGLTEFGYDGAGRLLREVDKHRGVEAWRTSYAFGGDRTHTTPPAGDTATTIIIDARQNITALRQYHGPTPSGTYDETRYAYDKQGELVSVTDPAGNTWTYQYDQRGRTIRVTDPDKGTMTSTYDAEDQVLTETDGRGTTLGHTYDELGRRTSTRQGSPTGPKLAEWVYDTLPGGLGKLTRSVRHHGGRQYTSEVTGYTAAGQPTGTRVIVPTGEPGLAGQYETAVTYHPDGSPATATLAAVTDLAAETLTFAYDDVGAPTWMVSPLSVYVGTVHYSKLGDLTQRRLGNFGKRTVISSTWDEASGRLTNVSAMYETTGGPVEVRDLAYAYDPAGNLVRIADSPGSATPSDTQCLRYDHLRRMTHAWTPLSTAADNCVPNPGPIGGPAPYRLSWTYDATGNRLTQQRVGTNAGTTTYHHPAPGAARPHAVTQAVTTGPTGTTSSSYAYDGAGNLTGRTVAGTTQTLTWDAEGRVATIADPATGSTEFLYDADGERLIRRDASGATLYLPDGTELRYHSGTGARTGTRYYDHLGTTVAVRTAQSLWWMVSDHHETAEVAVADATMTASQRRTLPFGELRGPAPASWPGDKGFVGGTLDPTGLIHLGARLYDQTLGRFISVDPLVDTADPQQMHGYAYGNNGPSTFTDPDGLIFGWVKEKASQVVNAVKEDPWKFAATVAAGVAVAVAVAAVCVGTVVGCAVLAGAAAGGAASGYGYGIEVRQGSRQFSARELAREVAVGATIGAATAGVGSLIGRAAGAVRNATRGSAGSSQSGTSNVVRSNPRAQPANRSTAHSPRRAPQHRKPAPSAKERYDKFELWANNKIMSSAPFSHTGIGPRTTLGGIITHGLVTGRSPSTILGYTAAYAFGWAVGRGINSAAKRAGARAVKTSVSHKGKFSWSFRNRHPARHAKGPKHKKPKRPLAKRVVRPWGGTY